ncbi:MAG: hypothetical protein A4E73_01140 [Syntrophaceae bacterium PtaU1.Bin231]|nr:MAG: hypothetical protein A4E73_01140 [Syntrophaceae bacterium PtaU1.Bin231]
MPAVVDDVLEARRQVDLRRLHGGKTVEGLVRERRCTVLDGAGQSVFLPRRFGQHLQRVEIDLHLGDRPVGQRHAAMGRARLDADLADALDVGPRLLAQFPAIAVHVGAQLLDGTVLPADLADLASHGNGDPLRLEVADHRRQLRGEGEVQFLLSVDGGLREVDQRRGVDVDVVEPRVERFPDQVLDGADLLLRVLRVFPRTDLKMVSLEEEGPPPSGLDRRRRDGGRILGGTLARVVDFRTGDLEDYGTGPGFQGGAEDGLGGVVGDAADVDGRDCEAADFPPSHRLVERLDRRGNDAHPDAGPADQPADRLERLAVGAENRRPHEIVDQG